MGKNLLLWLIIAVVLVTVFNTFNVANEMKAHNIQVNCISPIADTRMTDAIADFREREGIPDPRPAPAPAETVAPAFVFFACGDSDYITGEVLGFHRK